MRAGRYAYVACKLHWRCKAIELSNLDNCRRAVADSRQGHQQRDRIVWPPFGLTAVPSRDLPQLSRRRDTCGWPLAVA